MPSNIQSALLLAVAVDQAHDLADLSAVLRAVSREIHYSQWLAVADQVDQDEASTVLDSISAALLNVPTAYNPLAGFALDIVERIVNLRMAVLDLDLPPF